MRAYRQTLTVSETCHGWPSRTTVVSWTDATRQRGAMGFGPVGASMKAHAEPKATVTRTRERGRLVIGMAVVAGGTVPYRVPTGTGIPLREL